MMGQSPFQAVAVGILLALIMPLSAGDLRLRLARTQDASLAVVSTRGAAFGLRNSTLAEVDIPHNPQSPFWPADWTAWYRAGPHFFGPGKPNAPMWVIDDRPGVRPFAVCTPPRNGCSRWKRLLQRIEGVHDYMDNPHKNNELKRAGKQSIVQQKKLWTEPYTFKMMLARNPLERLLSAFLSKRGKKPFPLPVRFSVFVHQLHKRHLAWNRHWGLHWYPQTEICDSPARYHYDFVAKVEHRQIWMSRLENFLRIQPYTQNGWGEGGGPGSFQGAEDSVGSKTTTATRIKTLKRFYTPKLFKIACKYYEKDIRVLGYEKDIKAMWSDLFRGGAGPLRVVFHRRGARASHPHASLAEPAHPLGRP